MFAATVRESVLGNQIEHSVYGNFIRANEIHLITSNTNVLTLYRFEAKHKDSGHDASSFFNANMSARNTLNLIIVKRITLDGKITSLNKVKPQKEEGDDMQDVSGASSGSLDCLVVSFDRAKVIICRYSEEKQDFETLSMHCFEKEEFLPPKMAFDQQSTRLQAGLRMEPSGRCALMPIGEEFFAIMPIGRAGSYVVKYTDLYPDMTFVYDIQFLPHYNEPTICILYASDINHCVKERIMLDEYKGKFGRKKMMIMGLTLEAKTYVQLAFFDKLPMDVHSFVPSATLDLDLALRDDGKLIHVKSKRPEGLGSLIYGYLLGVTEIVLFDKRHHFMRIPLNPHCSESTEIPSVTLLRGEHEQLGVALNGAHAEILENELVISLEGGRMFVLEFSGTNLNRLQVRQIVQQVVPNMQTILFRLGKLFGCHLVFSVAVNGDAHSLSLISKQDIPVTPQANSTRGSMSALAHAEDDDDLYASVKSKTTLNVDTKLKFSGTPGNFLPQNVSKDWFIVPQCFIWTLFMKDPCLAQYSASRTTCLAGLTSPCHILSMSSRFSFTGSISKSPLDSPCLALWTVYYKDDVGLLVLSFEASTLVLEIASFGIRELERGELYLEGSTIFVGHVRGNGADEGFIVQVYERGFKVITTSLTMAEEYCSDTMIVSAQLFDDVLALLFDTGELMMYNARTAKPYESIQPVHGVAAFDLFNSKLTVANEDGNIAMVDLIEMKRCQNQAFSAIAPGWKDVACIMNHNEFLFILTKKQGLYVFKINAASQQYQLLPFPLNFCSLNGTSLQRLQLGSAQATCIIMLGQQPLWFIFSSIYDVPCVLPHISGLRAICPYNIAGSFGAAVLPFDEHSLELVRLPKLNLSQESNGHHANGTSLSLDAVYHCHEIKSARRSDSPGAIVQGDFALGRLFYLPHVNCYFGIKQTHVDFVIPPEEHVLGTSGGEANSRFVSQTVQQSCVLISGNSFEIIDYLADALHPYERVTCGQVMSLATITTSSKSKTLLVIGTVYHRGEDRPSRGRLLLFDVFPVVPDPVNRNVCFRVKLLHSEEAKGPVVALAGVLNRHCVVSLGSKSVVYSLVADDNNESESFDAIAFLDHGIYSGCINTLKNFIIVGDAFKSVALMCFQEDPAKLIFLGKDFLSYVNNSNTIPLSGAAVSYISCPGTKRNGEGSSDASVLSLVLGDMQQNLHLFSYIPSHPASMGGMRLLRTADYFLASYPLVAFYFSQQDRLPTTSTQFNEAKTPPVLGGSETLSSGGTCIVMKNGSLLELSFLPEKAYKRLFSLHVKLSKYAVSAFRALPTKSFRNVQTTCSLLGYTRPLRNVLDASSFQRTWSVLSPQQRDYLAKSELGYPLDRLSSDLLLLSPMAPF